jgi:hypothetical protein
MSDQDQRKKDGRDAGKKRQRMRADVAARKDAAGPRRPSMDEQDTVTYKPGSGGDRQQRPQAKHHARTSAG